MSRNFDSTCFVVPHDGNNACGHCLGVNQLNLAVLNNFRGLAVSQLVTKGRGYGVVEWPSALPKNTRDNQVGEPGTRARRPLGQQFHRLALRAPISGVTVGVSGVGEHDMWSHLYALACLDQIFGQRDVGTLYLGLIASIHAGQMHDRILASNKRHQCLRIGENLTAGGQRLNLLLGMHICAYVPPEKPIPTGDPQSNHGFYQWLTPARFKSARISGSANSNASTSGTDKRCVLCEV